MGKIAVLLLLVDQSSWNLEPFVVSNACLPIVSIPALYPRYIRRYRPSQLPLSCEVVENRSTVIGPQFLRGGGPKLVTALCNGGLPTTYRVAKFGWVLSAELHVWRKLQHFWRVGKNNGLIFRRSWTTVHEISGWCWRLLAISNVLSRFSLPCSLSKILALILATELWNRRK